MKRGERIRLAGNGIVSPGGSIPEGWGEGPVRSLERAEEDVIRCYLRLIMQGGHTGLPLRRFLLELERKLITFSLLVHMGNQKRVARLLGIKASTLCEKLKRNEAEPFTVDIGFQSGGISNFLVEFRGKRAEGTPSAV